MRRQARGLIFIAVLTTIAIVAIAVPRFDAGAIGSDFERGNDDTFLGLTLGLDLQGGTHLVYQAFTEDGSTPTSEDMEGARRIIESRVNQFGLSEPTVQLLGSPPNRILVQVPGLSGASISTSFVGNTVSASDLEEYFKIALNHPETVIETEVDDDGAELLIARLDELAAPTLSAEGEITVESEANQIRAMLGAKFPATIRTIYIPQTGTSTPAIATSTPQTATSTPQLPPPTIEAVNEIIGTLDRPGVRTTDLGDFTFEIIMPNPVPDEIGDDGQVVEGDFNKLRRSFTERFGPPLIFSMAGQINGYTVGGGIQEAKQLIGETARLEFRERTCGPLLDPADGTEWPPDGLTEDLWFFERCSNPAYFSETILPLTGDNLTNAYAGTQPGIARPVVNIEFDDEGADEFFEVTDRIARTRGLLAIYLDGEELVAPGASQGIAGGRAFIQGPDYTAERTRTTSIQLRAGALPVDLKLVQERNVEASLGQDTLEKSVLAGLIGLSLVLVFMIIYYKTPGLVAALALIMFASILIALFKMIPITLTLAGVAALILTVGTAVDANILIAERTKEELRSGRSLLAAINEGFARAWPSIRDSNVATLITAAVLFWFGDRLGTSIMQGFAATLALGTIVSVFTAYFASRVLSRTLASTFFGRKPSAWVPMGEVGEQRTERSSEAAR